MSWLYEALQRAERENPQFGKDNGKGLDTVEGDTFLQGIEKLASFSVRVPADNLIDLTRTAVTEAEPEVRSADAAVAPRSTPPESSNGYRHLKLPIKENSRLVFHTGNHGMATEQFRLLRRKLTQDFSKGGVLMVTSPTTGDGKTLTSINLSSCLAELGEPTLLIETDLRRPTMGKVLSCPLETLGLESLLSGNAAPDQIICVVEQLRFHVALVAKAPNNPSKLINGAELRQFLAWARAHFRWIVLDATPVLPAADVADLSMQADGVLLVIRAESTPRELSKRTFDILGKRLYGVILNGATIDSNPYYRHLTKYY